VIRVATRFEATPNVGFQSAVVLNAVVLNAVVQNAVVQNAVVLSAVVLSAAVARSVVARSVAFRGAARVVVARSVEPRGVEVLSGVRNARAVRSVAVGAHAPVAVAGVARAVTPAVVLVAVREQALEQVARCAAPQ